MTRREILERLRDGVRLTDTERHELDVLAVTSSNVLNEPAGADIGAPVPPPFRGRGSTVPAGATNRWTRHVLPKRGT